ncbi:MAG TPA: SIMPL domain-containing protein [Chloroflexia bacterium]|nr:SIMPL domain-containing protein [Chloroflexia bacterium]
MKANSKFLALGSVLLSAALIMAVFTAIWLLPREAAPAGAQGSQAGATPTVQATGDKGAEKPSTITVRGMGSINASPDTLVVNVGANIQAATVKEAQDQVNTIMDAITAQLKAAGVAEKDYRTVQYSVEPVLDYADGKTQPRLTGFRVVNMIEVSLHDLAKAPEVLDALTTAGANSIYNSGFAIADPAALYQQAYDKAVDDAEMRAQRLADMSGQKLGKLVSISEGSANVPGPVYDKGGAGMGAGGGVAIYPGQQAVSVDVVVTYEATSK